LYVVIQEFARAAITLGVILAASLILKFTWYDHLNEREIAPAGDVENGEPVEVNAV
jgi:hypothetical protein